MDKLADEKMNIQIDRHDIMTSIVQCLNSCVPMPDKNFLIQYQKLENTKQPRLWKYKSGHSKYNTQD